ncbi:nucleobindin-2-like [Genypterus blacodes]|uniref:nucleobindin-2-like n=1 Tax=Genypterus blacodes TaxID=154954 RepID=UPI003F77241C
MSSSKAKSPGWTRLKREELSRLRSLIKAKHDLKDGNGPVVDDHAQRRQSDHFNDKNPFEVDDLDRFIKAVTKAPSWLPLLLKMCLRMKRMRYEMMKERE